MAIDRKLVISALSELEVAGNADGLIPAYNVFVNQLPAGFWNSFAQRLIRSIDADLVEAGEALLVNAAHECGYHTGYGIITSEEWKAVVAPMVEKVPEDILVVYDSAYEEYATAKDMPNPLEHFRRGRRLLLLRTLSKAYGLAGVRVGYAIGPKDIIHGLMTCRIPFNVNVVALAGAMAALDDAEFLRKSREFNSAELAFLRQGLEGLPVVMPPSQTNFIFIDTGKKAPWLFDQLQRVGIIVRPIGARAIRVSPGTREDNERFVEHFRRLILSNDGAA